MAGKTETGEAGAGTTLARGLLMLLPKQALKLINDPMRSHLVFLGYIRLEG
jgi:hypothetical protein